MNEVFKLINLEEDKARDIKYQILIEKFKNGHFKKISFITGAGISTTAGIPDFRSSESGLFKKLQNKYNLSKPEEFFLLQTFLDRPELFYDFAKEFDLSKYKPTLTHVTILNDIFTLVVYEFSDTQRTFA
jgi:NAD-dependent SIR2 family protein deacetylase